MVSIVAIWYLDGCDSLGRLDNVLGKYYHGESEAYDALREFWTLTDINTAVAAEGTVEKIAELKAAFEAGTLNVFDTATEGFITVNGEALTSYLADVDTDPAYTADTEVVSDGYFHESEYRSAPYFDVNIDGIELLNMAF